MRLFDVIHDIGKFVGDIQSASLDDGEKSLIGGNDISVEVVLEISKDMSIIQRHLLDCLQILIKYHKLSNLEVPLKSSLPTQS